MLPNRFCRSVQNHRHARRTLFSRQLHLHPPQVAKAYDIKRSGINALINIAVLDNRQAGKPAVTATLTGEARNLLGVRKPLTFREVREGDAIYYLAELRFANEENYTFP